MSKMLTPRTADRDKALEYQTATSGHIYGGRRRVPYAYPGPVQLLEDFYAEVERILRERGVS